MRLTAVFASRPFALAALAAVVALAAGLATHHDADAAEAKKSSAPGAVQLAAADVVTVQSGALTRRIPVTGALAPLTRQVVNARIGAVVDDVPVREGEHVRAGQVLVRQDTANLAAQLRQAEAALASAKVELQLTEALEVRKKELFDKKYLSEVDFAAAQGDTEVKRAQVKVQEAGVAIAQKAVADAVITAPIDGIVAERNVEPGTNALPGTPLVTLVDLSTLEFAAAVPARDVPLVKPGADVRFTVDGFGERVFRGRVARINPVASAGSRAITVYAHVDNRDGALRGGMFANGAIDVALIGSQALRVPRTAVRSDAAGNTVWVIRGGRLALQAVTLGASEPASGLVEVRSGLAAGEQVVITPLGNRVPGTPVTVAAPTR